VYGPLQQSAIPDPPDGGCAPGRGSGAEDPGEQAERVQPVDDVRPPKQRIWSCRGICGWRLSSSFIHVDLTRPHYRRLRRCSSEIRSPIVGTYFRAAGYRW
jgi:hypothetical protein